MPDHVIALVASALNSRGKAVRGSSILVIGVAFKPDVSDDRNSPARPIVTGLIDAGAEVRYHDPRLPGFALADEHSLGSGPLLHSVDLVEGLDASPDCVVVVTPHSDIDWGTIFDRADLIVDTRNTSAGQAVRPGQVLRLGGGWS
jgi:UDP-N-acetyl-D-glucosamine dehydrogenase